MAQPTDAFTLPRPGMAAAQPTAEGLPQYRLGQIAAIWAAAALPMGVLGWWVAPLVARGAAEPGLARLAVLTVGLAWQFVLVLYLLYRETGRLSLADFGRRLWLTGPRSPATGESRGRLWWWLIPLVVLTAAYQMLGSGAVETAWVGALPRLAEPEGWSLGGAFDSPAFRAGLVGNWGFLALYVASALFNTVLGEELLFRGLLLPRMRGAFGKWDWVANGLLFGLYHLHQPWGIMGSILDGVFFYALPSRRFRSAWFGIIAHSGQSLFFTFLLLGLVLGLA